MYTQGKRCVLIIRQDERCDSYIEEVKSLVEATNYKVLKVFLQIRSEDPKYNIGKGKVKEIKEFIDRYQVDLVIFGNELKPRQAYNLEEYFQVPVMDRIQIILDIFAKHANTQEAKLQIKLARLTYELSRAKEKIRKAKLTELPGFHGLGRYPYDAYVRDIRRITSSIRRQLQKYEKHRKLHYSRRKKVGFSIVSIVGYTNAGKSTLFNALTMARNHTSPAMFTTLTTTVRRLTLTLKEKILVTDTVGFIRNLPPMLISAFKSTLEEITNSDVILVVVDASEDINDILTKVNTCFKILDEIKAHDVPKIIVLNKVDLITNNELKQRLKKLKEIYTTIIPVSAKYKTNLHKLVEQIVSIIKPNFITEKITLPDANSTQSFINDLHRVAPNADFEVIHDKGVDHVIFNVRHTNDVLLLINKWKKNKNSNS